MTPRNAAETAAIRWRLNFHHISRHCEARNTRSWAVVMASIDMGSKGLGET